MNWFDSPSHFGQLVAIRDCKVVFSVSSFTVNGARPFAPRKFDNPVLVLPDVGLRMVKVPFSRAARMPDSHLVLRAIWRASADASAMKQSASRCAWCLADDVTTVYQCPLCLMPSHTMCSQLAPDSAIGETLPAVPDGFELPFSIKFVCGMCSHWLQS